MPNGMEKCWGVDSINAPDLQEIKTHRLAKESGQLDSLGISENGRCGAAALMYAML